MNEQKISTDFVEDVSKCGPYAFPFAVPNFLCLGMSLRDYFAARAPEAPDDFGWVSGEVDSWQRRARWSYVYADAMLLARSAP